MVDLNQIEHATQEDIDYGVVLWAKLFNATTWEEVDALAQNNEYLQETISGVRQLSEDEQIRQQCEARESFVYWERLRNIAHQQALDTIKQQAAELQEKDNEIAQLRAQLADMAQVQS